MNEPKGEPWDRLIHECIAATLTTLTWVALNIVIVILIYYADRTDLERYGQGFPGLMLATHIAVGAIATITSAIALIALFATLRRAKRAFVDARHPMIGLLMSAIGVPLTFLLVLFASLVVAALATQALKGMGIQPSTVHIEQPAEDPAQP